MKESVTSWEDLIPDRMLGTRTGRATSATPNIEEVPRLTLGEMVHIKQNYEAYLQDVITMVLKEFRAATGYTPSSVDVEMTDVTQVGDCRPRCVVSQVKMRIDL